ncbi:MAG: hypothetical protein AAF228_03935 [Pseudomonadota bacterium]
MKKSGSPPTALPAAEYDAIEKAMMETTRGRWFLNEFAERNRRQDTKVLLDAISKLEGTVQHPQGFQNIEKIQSDLVEMGNAIQRARSEISSLKLPDDDNSQLLTATEELDDIVMTTEKATHSILHATEDIQETVWALREEGLPDAPCARIDAKITDIYTACSFQDITGQRTHKIVQVLRYLEARIEAMVSIWGLASETAKSDVSHLEDKREDSHLLNGPPSFHENGLEQNGVDSVFSEAGPSEHQNQTTEHSTDEYNAEVQSQQILDETAEQIGRAAQKVENLSERTIGLAKDLLASKTAEISDSNEQSSQQEIGSSEFGGIEISTSLSELHKASQSISTGTLELSNQPSQLSREQAQQKSHAIEHAKVGTKQEAISRGQKDISESSVAPKMPQGSPGVHQSVFQEDTSAMIEEATRLTDTLRNAVLDIENLTQAPQAQHVEQKDQVDDVPNLASNIAHHLKEAETSKLNIEENDMLDLDLGISSHAAKLRPQLSQGALQGQNETNRKYQFSDGSHPVPPDLPPLPTLDNINQNAADVVSQGEFEKPEPHSIKNMSTVQKNVLFD